MYQTIAQVKAANKAAGENWFARATMKFWACKIHGGIRKGRYFITSERDVRNENRYFSIRQAMPDGSISTVGEFCEYRDIQAAREGLKRLPKSRAVK